MSHLMIYRGLPASGKSTHANAYVAKDYTNRIRVNRDTLRQMAHDGEFVKGVTEEKILIARNALVEKFLRIGMTVLVDDTNLPKRSVTDLVKIANKLGVTWEIVDFTHIDVDLCVQRDIERSPELKASKGFRAGKVGDVEIRDMHNRYLKGKQPVDLSALQQPAVNFKPYVPNMTKFTAYIVDIDGTVAKMNGRSPYDYTSVLSDIPKYKVLDVIRDLHDQGHSILFTSGRPDSCREDTEKWLYAYAAGISHKLFMRSTGDTRADFIVKLELFNENIRDHYDVQGVFDDRDQVVEMWRKIGLTCFQVDFGDF